MAIAFARARWRDDASSILTVALKKQVAVSESVRACGNNGKGGLGPRNSTDTSTGSAVEAGRGAGNGACVMT